MFVPYARDIMNPQLKYFGYAPRYSLRILLLLTLFLASLLAYTGRMAREQADAVLALERAGCRVTYSDSSSLTLRECLRSWMDSAHERRNAFAIFGERSAMTDNEMAYLKVIPTATILYLDHARITDNGVVHIQNLEELQSLSLSHTQVTDAGLYHLRALRTLCVLLMDDTCVSNAGLFQLRDLTQLTVLSLSRTLVTDAGLKEACKLPNLQVLYLDDTEITDTGLLQISCATQLRMLALSGTRVTSAAVDSLRKKLPELMVTLNYPRGKTGNISD